MIRQILEFVREKVFRTLGLNLRRYRKKYRPRTLALSTKIKQKYQNGSIHRKLIIPIDLNLNTILRYP